jgi:hypothetical protein
MNWLVEAKGLSLKEQWRKLYQEKLKCNYPGLWGKSKNIHKYDMIKEQLPGVFKKYNIKTLTDCGCGNFFWLNSIDWKGVKYLGLDIVPELIESNKVKYPQFDFKCINIVEEIPAYADMFFVRSVFIHLTNADIMKAINNIKSSGSKYLMATTAFNVDSNKDTKCLMLTKRDLTKPPFNFPKPLEVVMEYSPKNPDELYSAMGIWEIDKL